MNSNYKKYVLKNGLRIILLPDSSKEVVSTLVLVGTGSRYESDDIAGISHVLEHMFYKGSKKRPTSELLSSFIESIGGEHNAFTSKEYTGFYTKVAAKHLSKSIDFLSDLLINPFFKEDQLEKEKLVILQEYDMYEDLPMEIVGSKFEETLIGKNSLGRDVIGLKNSIKAVTREKLVNYLKSYYIASNIVIVVAGNIDSTNEKDLMNLIEKSFTFDSGEKIKAEKASILQGKRLKVVSKKTEQAHLVVGFPGSSYGDDDRYALKVLAMILGGSMSSRMFLEIREKRGLSYAVRTSVTSYVDAGMIDTYAGVPHDKASEAIKAIILEYKKITSGDISLEEFLRAKEIIYGKMLINLEDTNELANHYASFELLREEILTPSEVIEKYKKISLNDVKEVAKKYLKEDNLVLGLVGSDFKEKDFINDLKF